SSSSSSPRVTRPSSRKTPARPVPVRSPSRTLSFRQRPTSSSTSERASSRPIPPRAESSSTSASTRSAVSATAPTPARTSFSATSRAVLTGSAMWACPAALAAALALRLRGRRGGLRNHVAEGRRGLRGGRLGRLLERQRPAVDHFRSTPRQPWPQARPDAAVVQPTLGLLALAAGELRFTLLPDREQRSGD